MLFVAIKTNGHYLELIHYCFTHHTMHIVGIEYLPPEMKRNFALIGDLDQRAQGTAGVFLYIM